MTPFLSRRRVRRSMHALAGLSFVCGFGALLVAGCPNGSQGPPATDNNDSNTPAPAAADALIADHFAAAQFAALTAQEIQQASAHWHIFYGHTSHGSQLVTGMQMLADADARYAFNAGPGHVTLEEDTGIDLGHAGDLAWVAVTRTALNRPGNNFNLVVWSWCGGVSDNTPAGIAAYLSAMNQLERDYPHVRFVYMTGHLDGTGPTGNLNVRNDQIRDYCRTHGKVLFDFADIESYDPAGNYYASGSDACEWCATWCALHACPPCDDCAHSACFNCYQKGRAFWWLLARLVGRSGG